MKFFSFFLALLVVISSCNTQEELPSTLPESMYFPPIASSVWETKSISSLNWNQNAIQPLNDFLFQTNTKSFMILVNGRIVLEEYYNGHTAADTWEWNSAGKTLVAATTGIAQQEGLLTITAKASDYLGEKWTNMPLAAEDLIEVRHLLTMTSGIDDTKQLIIKPNLTYVADAGTRWAYSNVFQKLIDVVAQASNQDFQSYFNDQLKSKLGMDGFWNFGAIFTIYHSSARSMARFGLLALNKGTWNNEEIISDSFFEESITSSQLINPSYGYLWWLNGKSSFRVPGQQTLFQGALIPNAPADTYAAMGAKDQRIYVVPSKNMVVIRMGESSDPTNPDFAVSGFDEAIWDKINALIN